MFCRILAMSVIQRKNRYIRCFLSIFWALRSKLMINAPLGILFYLTKKVSKKLKPDSNRPRLIFRDRIYFAIASNPAKAGPHFGSYCLSDLCLNGIHFG